jgi:ABC-type lipoprotein release transport system permease subunit
MKGQKMRLFLRLAWRNIWRHRRRTIIVITSIAFTMALMMLYDGMIAGFTDAIYSNAIKVLGGNIQIHAAGYHEKVEQMPLLPIDNEQETLSVASEIPGSAAVVRRIKTGGMATNREGAFGITIVGIEPENETNFSLVAGKTNDGRFLRSDDLDSIVIGKGLASAMDVKVGDQITLVGKGTHQQMRKRTMTVVGVFDLGLTDIEKRIVYISLGEAQSLYGLDGQVTEIAIALDRIGEEDALINSVKSRLPQVEIESWQTNYPDLENAIATKSGVMGIFSVVLLVIAGIGIMNLLLMAIFERTREIGVLGALGMKPMQISILFLLEGALMGLVGAAVGVALGLLCNLGFAQIGLDYSQFASLTEYTALISGRIYPSLGTEQLVSHLLTVIVISILASFYPAYEASLNDPSVSLHAV